MEKSPETQPSLARKTTALLASAGLALSYGVTLPVENTPERTDCGDPIQAIAPYHYSEILPDISSEGVLSSEKLAAHLERIEEVYGIPVVIPETPSYETASQVATTLAGVLSGLEEASPALTNALDIPRLTILEEVDPSDTSIQGQYFSGQNEIVIKYASIKSVASVTAHELIGHAIDFTVLCPSDPKVDPGVAQYNTIRDDLQNPDDRINLDPIYYTVNDQRVFANSYASKDAVEDRATQIEWLFYERGIIQPEDPDYNSPFASKQTEILRRLEMLLPGVTAHLEQKTSQLRINSTELAKSIEDPYQSGESAQAFSILAYAQRNDKKVEQLRNTTAIISLPGEKIITIQDPVVIRDSEGHIKALAWTPLLKGTNSSLETQYYLNEYVHISYTEESHSHHGYIEITSDNGRGFIQGGLRIDGVWSKEIESPN